MKKNNRIKVYFDAFPLSTERISGIGHLIAETVRALSLNPTFLRKYELVLIFPKGKEAIATRYGFKNVAIRTTPVTGRIWSALVLYRLLPPADLFFGKGIYVFGNYTTWPLIRSKSVTYVHDLNFLVNPETVTDRVRKVLTKNLPLWIKRASYIATISNFSMEEIKSKYGVDQKKIAVVYCGVDHAVFFRRTTNEVNKAKQKYAIEGDYILFLSNVEPRKNLSRLLEAYSMLGSKKRKKYRFVIIGAEGWLNENIKDQIGRIGEDRIVWPKEYVPDIDLPAVISGAKLLAHPALYEGFGISPLQALACGTPVLVSNGSSLPEVVGDVGVYVDPLDTSNIYEQLDKILSDDPAVYHSQKSLVVQSEMFSWEKSGNSLLEILDNLIK